MSESPFQIWSGGGCELAEGTRWLGDRLVFTDILAGTLREAAGRGGSGRWPARRVDRGSRPRDRDARS